MATDTYMTLVPPGTAKPAATQEDTTLRPPADLQRLSRFFGSQGSLACALGVHRNTVSAWHAGKAVKLRRGTAERALLMSTLAEQVARYLSTDEAVGAWLLNEQPGLGVPVDVVLRDGEDGYEHVLRHLAQITAPVSVGDLSAVNFPDEEEFLDGMKREIGVEQAEQIGSPVKTIEDPDADPDFLASLD